MADNSTTNTPNPVLYRTPIIDIKTGLVSREWVRYFESLNSTVISITNVINTTGGSTSVFDDFTPVDVAGTITNALTLASDTPHLFDEFENSVDWSTSITQSSFDVTRLFDDNSPLTNLYYGPWQSWTPIITGSGVMTVSGTSITAAKFMKFGNLLFFYLIVSFTLGGTASTDVQITLPPFHTLETISDAVAIYGSGIPNGLNQQNLMCFVSLTLQQFLVRLNPIANWPLGAQNGIRISGFYSVG